MTEQNTEDEKEEIEGQTIDEFPESIPPYKPYKLLPGKKQVILYLRKCLSTIIDAAVLLTITAAGYFAILNVCNYLWHLYMATYMGTRFLELYPLEAEETSYLLHMNYLQLSIRMTVYSFIISITVASICRLLYAARILHDNCGFLIRILICGFPLTILIAWYVQPIFEFQAFKTAIMVSFFPALCVFSRCFNYTAKLLPELGDLIKLVNRESFDSYIS